MVQTFTDRHFTTYKDFIFNSAGIRFNESKRQQLETKIRKAMHRVGIESFDEYFTALSKTQNEDVFQQFINIITTNTTEFFREKEHFQYLMKNINAVLQSNPRILRNREMRVWCAASSSGQEPVSIAMTLKQCLPRDVMLNMLATDINSEVLSKAMRGQYLRSDCQGIPLEYRTKYVRDLDAEKVQISADILSCIKYRKFNLMTPFPFKKQFDIIFCRNVMIYFPDTVQRELVRKFDACLIPGGYLFVGHTESLLNKKSTFVSVAPSVYTR